MYAKIRKRRKFFCHNLSDSSFCSGSRHTCSTVLQQWSSGGAHSHDANGGAHSPSQQGTAELLDCRIVTELVKGRASCHKILLQTIMTSQNKGKKKNSGGAGNHRVVGSVSGLVGRGRGAAGRALVANDELVKEKGILP